MTVFYTISGLGSSVLAGIPMIAQAATDSGIGLETIVQTGVTGTLAAALLIFARTAYQRETQRADRLEEKLDALNETIRDKYATALSDAARAVADATAMLAGRQR